MLRTRDRTYHSTRRSVLRAASRVNSSTPGPTSATTAFVVGSIGRPHVVLEIWFIRNERARPFSAPTGNAAKHFRSRIRENSEDLCAYRILTNSATIRSHAFSTSENASRSCLKGRNRTRWTFVPPFQGCLLLDSQPGASLAAHAAPLCPRLICSAPSGQCPSLHVNRRPFRRIRSRAHCRMKPTSGRSAAGTNGAANIPRKLLIHSGCR
jgi:hypothetical protein